MDDDLDGLNDSLFTSTERQLRRIGDFVVLDLLGQGAMGQVFLVRHHSEEQLHALKLLPKEMASDEELLTRFAREVEALSILSGHPGIVAVRGSGRTAHGIPYYVMEYVEGVNLKQALQKGLARERALDAIERVAHALEYAHQQGLLHRDIKPDNVMIDMTGKARLTDFGLARAVRQAQEGRLTQTGQALGTPAYMAPEQATSEEDRIGTWTDVWGLGVLLYNVLTGSTPYTGATQIEIYTQLHDGAPITPPSAIDPSVSPALDAVTMGALGVDPKDRFESAEAFRRALRKARSGRAEGVPALLKVLVVLALVCVALTLTVAVKAREKQEEPAVAVSQAELESAAELLAQGKAQEALSAIEALRAREGLSPEAGARLDELRGQASALVAKQGELVEEVKLLFADGMLTEARALWKEGLPPFAEAAYVLALTGSPRLALAQGADVAPSHLARIAAWAEDSAATQRALEGVEDLAERAALSWELRAYLPALETTLVPEGARGEWARLARAEEALARGWLGVAERELADEVSDDRLALQRAIARARAEFARGELDDALDGLNGFLRGDAELHAFDRARASSWLVWFRVAAGKGPGSALKLAPGAPLSLAARGERSPWFGHLRAARAAANAGKESRAKELLAAAGVDPARAAESFCLAELELCARGRAGAVGLRIAQAQAQIAAARSQGARGYAERALENLSDLAEVASSSPALALLTSRAKRTMGTPDLPLARACLQRAPFDDAPALEVGLVLSGLEEREHLAKGWPAAAGTNVLPPDELDPLRALDLVTEGKVKGGELWREAQLAKIRVVMRRMHAHRRDPTVLRGQARPIEALLEGVDAEQIAEARVALAGAIAAGDLSAADKAAERLSAYANRLTPVQLAALRLASQSGRDGARGRAYLGCVGDLPAWARLRGKPELALWVPGLRLARVEARPRLDPAALDDLASVVRDSPEQALYVIALIRSRLTPPVRGALAARLDSGPPSLTRSLRKACFWLAASSGTTAFAKQALEQAAVSAEEACAQAPEHAGAHLLAGLALVGQNSRSPAAAEHLSLACASMPWAAAPHLARLSQHEVPDLVGAVDTLFAMGFLGASPALKGTPHAEKVESLRAAALDGEALELRLREGGELGETSAKLWVRLYGGQGRTPLRRAYMTLRLRSARDVGFVAGDQFDASISELPATLQGAARIAHELALAWRVTLDPSTWRGLESFKRSEVLKARRRIRGERRARASEESVALLVQVEPAGELGRLTDLEWRMPGPWGEGQQGAQQVLPPARALWDQWFELHHPALRASALGLTKVSSDEDRLSNAGLAEPGSLGQALLVAAQRPVFWAFQALSQDRRSDELVLAIMRSVGFDRRRPLDEAAFATLSLASNLGGEDEAYLRALAGTASTLKAATKDPQGLVTLVEGDMLLNLAFNVEEPERKALIAKGVAASLSRELEDVPKHAEQRTSASWRRARARLLAGDEAEGLAELEEFWAVYSPGDFDFYSDPLLPRLRKLIPRLDKRLVAFESGVRRPRDE